MPGDRAPSVGRPILTVIFTSGARTTKLRLLHCSVMCLSVSSLALGVRSAHSLITRALIVGTKFPWWIVTINLYVTRYNCQDTPQSWRKGNASSREPSGAPLHRDDPSRENKRNPSVTHNYLEAGHTLQSHIAEKYTAAVTLTTPTTQLPSTPTSATNTSPTTRQTRPARHFKPPSTLMYGFVPITTEKSLEFPSISAGANNIKPSYGKIHSKKRKYSNNSFLNLLNSVKKKIDNFLFG